ncbi:PREDICTED: probable protein phosphatase 2C 8 [Tarenaya hassleriana]|uniref:probable protein phosphatase 2C 8 n=1 Tax=Tarenaya hassleriana TaxID=28532 RepID=UPI00053C5E4D|nr:PREDICTED: probable protein phosphatase 2C 8 [Tarenaya hassleriana]
MSENAVCSTEMEKSSLEPIHKREADPDSGEDLVSPAKKSKNTAETDCGASSESTEDSKQRRSGEDEQRKNSGELNGGEPEPAARGGGDSNRCAQQDNPSCGTEVVKGFDIEADVAEDKGSRHTMEDAWVVLPDASLDFPGKLRCAHFAIYDGHGGRLAADFVQKHLHHNVLSAGLPRELLDVKAAKKAILEGFRKADESLLQESASGGWQDGATAVCVWILDQKVFIANIGDAKAVVARSSTTNGSDSPSKESNFLKAILLTREHKAIFPQERTRIQKAGGSISSNGRLQGRLEVSRAFGDRQFKKLGVIATPDIHSFDITERELFMILGCDGLWGVFGPSDAVEFVQKLLKEGLTVSTISRRLVKEAVRERRCKDNCTAIVIVFRHR